ncbi:MAG TPA: L,D-transpeptidase [Chthoniobacterales bacterium]|nr:L,D-transpeptidase [Chthoniobacterales bacterium]
MSLTLLSSAFAQAEARSAARDRTVAAPPATVPAQKRTAAPPAQKVFPVALPNYDEETATRLQIFLDNAYFGPGKIDGKMGEFFRKALISYKHAHAMPKTGAVDSWLFDQVPATYTTYTIRPEDLKFVGPLPSDHAEQAKLKFQPYTSILEFVAERYHSAQEFIERLNPGKDWDKIQPGEALKVPNVLPFEIEKVTEQKLEPNPAFATRKIFVDTKERLLEVFDNDQLVCVFPITPGSQKLPAPVGTWKILGAAVWPWFRYDEAMLNHGVRSDNFYNLPPGPNNLVGVLWMGLNKPGIGIHGTNNPETIGRAASHGCIRLANWDAARVKDLVSVGNTVIIF